MKVFLSYAKEDQEKVKECYEALKMLSFTPWMDYFDLLPGQNWDECLKKNMSNSDVVITFLSQNSVKKIGYVQREVKYFLDKRNNFPNEYIYMIPVLLNECEVPAEVSREIQFINIENSFSGNNWNRVVQSLRLAATQRDIELINNESDSAFKIDNCVIEEHENGMPVYQFYATCPKFISKTSIEALTELNKILEGQIYSDLASFRTLPNRMADYKDSFESSYQNTIESLSKENVENPHEFQFHNDCHDESYAISFISSSFISIVHNIHWYGSGAAHGNHSVRTSNFAIINQKLFIVNPFSFFNNDLLEDAKKFIINFCKMDLIKQKFARYKVEPDTDSIEWIVNGISKLNDYNHGKSISINNDGFTIFFTPYEVDCFAAGDWQVKIPFNYLEEWLDQSNHSLYSLLKLNHNYLESA